MAQLDESVHNLERFLGHLVQAIGAVEQVDDHIQDSVRRFAQIQDDAADEGEGLNDTLEELGSALDTGRDDARDALSEVAQAGTDGQQAAGEAEDGLEQAASDVEDKAERVRSELDEAHAQLTQQGFEPLLHTLDEAAHELDAEVQEAAQAFDELETALQGFESEAQAAWDGVETELDQATSRLAQAEAALTSEATEGTHGFDAAAASIEQDCTALEGDVDTIYDVLDSGVDAQHQEWEQATRGAAQEALTFVDAAAAQRVEQPARAVEDEALASLDREYDALGTVLDGATTLAGELEPLTAELAKCRHVVGQIDELLNALAG